MPDGEEINFTAPPSGDGRNLTVEDFVANINNESLRRNTTNPGLTLAPASDRTSIRVNYRRDLAEDLSLSTSFSYGRRKTESVLPEPVVQSTAFIDEFFTIRGNPYNPLGQTVQVNFAVLEAGAGEAVNKQDNFGLTADLDGVLSTAEQDWDWSLSINYSRSEGETRLTNLVDIGGIRDGISCLTFDSTVSEDCLNPFGETFSAGNPDNAAQFFLGPVLNINDNEVLSSEFTIKGDLLELPGGSIASVWGASWQKGTVDTSYGLESGTQLIGIRNVGLPGAFDATAERTVTSAFTEFLIPIFGDDNALPVCSKWISAHPVAMKVLMTTVPALGLPVLCGAL